MAFTAPGLAFGTSLRRQPARQRRRPAAPAAEREVLLAAADGARLGGRNAAGPRRRPQPPPGREPGVFERLARANSASPPPTAPDSLDHLLVAAARTGRAALRRGPPSAARSPTGGLARSGSRTTRRSPRLRLTTSADHPQLPPAGPRHEIVGPVPRGEEIVHGDVGPAARSPLAVHGSGPRRRRRRSPRPSPNGPPRRPVRRVVADRRSGPRPGGRLAARERPVALSRPLGQERRRRSVTRSSAASASRGTASRRPSTTPSSAAG